MPKQSPERLEAYFLAVIANRMHGWGPNALRWALSGGEDYELCFTVPELNRGTLDVALAHLGAKFTCIGQIMPESEGLKFVRDGAPVTLDWKGYDHFA